MQPRILVVGTGAIGGFYGGKLAQAEADWERRHEAELRRVTAGTNESLVAQLEAAQALENLTRHAGMHAAGVVMPAISQHSVEKKQQFRAIYKIFLYSFLTSPHHPLKSF